MKNTTFSKLADKEVVNCRDGRIVGYVTDLKINTESGNVISVFIKESTGTFCFSKSSTLEIPFDCIDKIGDDIIIVNASFPLPAKKEKPKKEKKSFFG